MELKDEADFFVAEAGEGGVVQLGSIFAINENATGRIDGAAVLVESGGAIEATQQIEQRALSRAAGADDGDVFPGMNLQVDAFEDVVDGIAGAEYLWRFGRGGRLLGWDFWRRVRRRLRGHAGSFASIVGWARLIFSFTARLLERISDSARRIRRLAGSGITATQGSVWPAGSTPHPVIILPSSEMAVASRSDHVPMLMPEAIRNVLRSRRPLTWSRTKACWSPA